MAVIADSGAIFAIYDAADAHHARILDAIERERERGPLIVPMAILGEVDYLLREFLGVDAELDFLDGIMRGFYTLESLTDQDVVRCQEIVAQYRAMNVGLADAAVAATAERLGVHRILTVDERDFRVIRPKKGQAFVLLPADS